MTVGQLIEQLQKYPPDLDVVTRSSEGDCDLMMVRRETENLPDGYPVRDEVVVF